MLVVAALAALAAAQAPCSDLVDPVDRRALHAEIRGNLMTNLLSVTYQNAVFMVGGDGSGQNLDYSLFRQDHMFVYLTGVLEPEFQVAVLGPAAYTVLFVPERDAYWATWNGVVRTKEEIREQYGVDEVQYDDQIATVLHKYNIETVFMMMDQSFSGMNEFSLVRDNTLNNALRRGREVKTASEIELMKVANVISSNAHVTAMAAVQPGWSEFQSESLFLYECYNCGSRFQAYNPIFGSGANGAVLHYSVNEDRMEDGELLLVDAGAEYRGYASDITRTYPVNGQFTPRQAELYNVVLKALNECIEMLRPGESWSNVSAHATRVLSQGLIDAGLVIGTVDDIISNRIINLFYPHSLGHMIGIAVHDVEALFVKGAPVVEPIERHMRGEVMDISLLEPGMVLTVEPGLYFIPALLEPAFEDANQAQFLNATLLREYFDFGGIRIEDDCAITETGYDNLTNVPKTVADIEAAMRA